MNISRRGFLKSAAAPDMVISDQDYGYVVDFSEPAEVRAARERIYDKMWE